MNPWLPTLIISGAIIATILIVRALSHKADEALTADFGDAEGGQ